MGAKELQERARAGRGKRANARGSVANAHAPRPGTPSSPSRAVPPVFQLPRSLWPRVGRGARSRRRAAPATLERTVAPFLLAALPLAPPARTTRAAPSRAPRHPHCPVQSPRRHVSRLSARRAPVAGRTLEKGSDAPRWRFFTIKKTRAHPPARPHACYRTLHRCAPRAAGSEE